MGQGRQKIIHQSNPGLMISWFRNITKSRKGKELSFRSKQKQNKVERLAAKQLERELQDSTVQDSDARSDELNLD